MNKNFKIKSIFTSFFVIFFITFFSFGSDILLKISYGTKYAEHFKTNNNILINTIYAQELQETTEESTNSASLESIKQIIKDNLSSGAVQGAIDNLINKKIATIGEVTRVTDETITINDHSGTRIIPIEGTHSITKNNKEIKVSDIAIENWVTILGKIKDDNFSPVFIYVYTKSLQPKKQIIDIGTITEITKNTITITPRSGENEKTVTILNSTDFEDLDGIEISLSDLEEDITILISGHENDDKIEASTIKSLAPANIVEDN